MSTATTATTGTASGTKDGMPSMIAYLTRVLKTPTIGAFWEELADQAREANWSPPCCSGRSPTGSPRAL